MLVDNMIWTTKCMLVDVKFIAVLPVFFIVCIDFSFQSYF